MIPLRRLGRRLAPIDQTFVLAWAVVFIGIFELLFDLYRVGLVKHPIWSEVWGWPCPHHLYIFHGILLAIWNIARRWEI